MRRLITNLFLLASLEEKGKLVSLPIDQYVNPSLKRGLLIGWGLITSPAFFLKSWRRYKSPYRKRGPSSVRNRVTGGRIGLFYNRWY
jgi:hypothetical protein